MSKDGSVSVATSGAIIRLARIKRDLETFSKAAYANGYKMLSGETLDEKLIIVAFEGPAKTPYEGHSLNLSIAFPSRYYFSFQIFNYYALCCIVL